MTEIACAVGGVVVHTGQRPPSLSTVSSDVTVHIVGFLCVDAIAHLACCSRSLRGLLTLKLPRAADPDHSLGPEKPWCPSRGLAAVRGIRLQAREGERRIGPYSYTLQLPQECWANKRFDTVLATARQIEEIEIWSDNWWQRLSDILNTLSSLPGLRRLTMRQTTRAFGFGAADDEPERQLSVPPHITVFELIGNWQYTYSELMSIGTCCCVHE